MNRLIRSLAPLWRLWGITFLDLATWGQHPLSPSLPAQIIRRNQLERPVRLQKGK